MNDSQVAIRLYCESDYDQVAELWRVQLNLSRAHNNPALSIARKMAHQPELFFVAECDGAVVGTALGGYDGHRGWLYSVAVYKEYSRRGIASKLVDHIVTRLRELDCAKVNLQVMPDNPDGIAFWEALGWVVEDRVSMGKVM